MIQPKSITAKMLIPMVLLVVVVGGISVAVIQRMLSQSLTIALKERGVAASKSLAAACTEPLLLDDIGQLETILAKEQKAVSGLAYAFVVNAGGNVAAHTFDSGFPLHLLWENTLASGQQSNVAVLKSGGTTVFDFAAAIDIDGRIAGVSRIGLSTRPIRKTMVRMGMVSTLTLILLLVAGGAGAIAWARAIVLPIGRLEAATKEMVAGKLEQKVDIRTGDEIQRLAESFNRMAQTVVERTRELSQANINLEEAQRIAHVGNWEWDLTNDRFIGSDECYRIFGKEPHSLIPDLETYLGFIHPDDRAVLKSAFEKALKAIAPFNLEHRIMREDNTIRFVHGRGEVVRGEDGRPLRIIGTLQDITEARQAQQALQKAHDELEIRVEERTAELAVAKELAEQADRLKSAFLATMSHELRTPLNSIIGFTGIILQGMVGELNEEQRKQLNMVRDSANHLLALINDVLDISKIEAGQLEIRTERFNAREAIEKSIRVVQPLADKKRLPVNMTIDSRLGEITGDRRRVEQILINLLNNAIKFTDKGNISLTASLMNHAPSQMLSEKSRALAKAFLQVDIADTGIGIKAEDMQKLFKPFQQIDIGTTRRYEGTGLGLSICLKLARLLGGNMTALSDGEGKGSTFTLTLPA